MGLFTLEYMYLCKWRKAVQHNCVSESQQRRLCSTRWLRGFKVWTKSICTCNASDVMIRESAEVHVCTCMRMYQCACESAAVKVF